MDPQCELSNLVPRVQQSADPMKRSPSLVMQHAEPFVAWVFNDPVDLRLACRVKRFSMNGSLILVM